MQRLDVIGATVSALLHLILLLVMLSPAMQNASRARSSAQPQAIEVSLLTEQQQTADETPAQAIEPPPQISTPIPQATAVPPPKPATKAAPKKSAAPSTATTATTAQDTKSTPNDSQELEDVVGRIRDNWLEPPGISKTFRCRLRLQYAAGGTITGVQFLQGCGTLALDDSVKRAIWKTQSLTLLKAKHEAGSIDIEFTP